MNVVTVAVKPVKSKHFHLMGRDNLVDFPPFFTMEITCVISYLHSFKNPQMSSYFQEIFNSHVSASAGVANVATEDIGNNIKTSLLKTTEEVCGTTRPHHWHLEPWWWNEHVEKAIAARRKAFKA